MGHHLLEQKVQQWFFSVWKGIWLSLFLWGGSGSFLFLGSVMGFPPRVLGAIDAGDDLYSKNKKKTRQISSHRSSKSKIKKLSSVDFYHTP